MKRIIAAVAATAIAAPLALAPMAMAGGFAAGAVPNVNKTTVLQAGATRLVLLGKVNSGTGYAWKWTRQPKSPVAKGVAPRVVVSRKGMPGAPTTVYARIIGLGEGKTSGVLGLFAPGGTSPTKTVTIAITVTEDGR